MKITLSLVLLTFSFTVFPASYTSKYIGETQRKIKTLSPADIDELSNGGGWGLAKAAELNGYPGPVHLLEMADKIGLTSEQREQITTIYNDMKLKATALGNQLINLEAALNDHFSGGTINATMLEAYVDQIEHVRGELRVVHLSAHLQTPQILTSEQVRQYNELRGYDKDPCQHVPEGHNATMWKKHNGCQ